MLAPHHWTKLALWKVRERPRWWANVEVVHDSHSGESLARGIEKVPWYLFCTHLCMCVCGTSGISAEVRKEKRAYLKCLQWSAHVTLSSFFLLLLMPAFFQFAFFLSHSFRQRVPRVWVWVRNWRTSTYWHAYRSSCGFCEGSEKKKKEKGRAFFYKLFSLKTNAWITHWRQSGLGEGVGEKRGKKRREKIWHRACCVLHAPYRLNFLFSSFTGVPAATMLEYYCLWPKWWCFRPREWERESTGSNYFHRLLSLVQYDKACYIPEPRTSVLLWLGVTWSRIPGGCVGYIASRDSKRDTYIHAIYIYIGVLLNTLHHDSSWLRELDVAADPMELKDVSSR